MTETKFIELKSHIWKDLETLSKKINKKGIRSLKSQEVKDFLSSFRQCSVHLAYARSHYPGSTTVTYLNSLVSDCHSHIYAVKKVSTNSFKNYILYGFPNLLREFRTYILLSFGFFIFGVFLSMFMVFYNPDYAILFLPEAYINGIKEGITAEGQWNYPLMSSYIMFNNISVSLRAFVFGITLGIGTIYVLFINGALLGALTALVYLYGEPLSYWSLILPHGIIELAAIFIAGASGLIIARFMLIPGEYSRKQGLIYGSKKAISLIVGIVLMLVIAGIIEGFFTPLNISEGLKLSFAALTAIILALYFSIPYFIKK
ncbi:stage II sporulation protein M [Alkaliphilus transvaalensis]|uniref:stage II sporulation protein M n=1 Tax=Alkaliphilus transvaalensis TaxID=114628 RepID=UPI00047BC83D|nr:stage II sporulation protein M [Alkaliphilus transvaalensis]